MSSYPKAKEGSCFRRSNPRKRSFHGNQHTMECDEGESGSASAKKLDSSTSEDVITNPLHFYRIIEFFTVFTALSDILICRSCKQDIKFEQTGIRGLGFKLLVKCHCGSRQINSCPLINTGFEINRRIVFVMRLLGVGRQGLNLFCNYMDIGSGIAEETYNRIFSHIHAASKTVFDYCCKKAVEEEKKENEKRERPILNFKVSGDGTWKKRGFKSLFGVTTLIAYYCGKVVDLDVRSSYCHACTRWQNKSKTSTEYLKWLEEHGDECTKNHEGSSGSMEVESVKKMFCRSEELYGVKYGNYIGDGDSKTFSAILNLDPYDNEPVVVKSECIGHVQKRMGTANESFNSTVWRLAPKHLHSGLKVVQTAAYLATGLFNEGNSSLLRIMNEAGIIVGSQSFNFAEHMDQTRVSRQNRRNSLETKEGRIARKDFLQAQNEHYEEEEGLLYGAGIAD